MSRSAADKPLAAKLAITTDELRVTRVDRSFAGARVSLAIVTA